MSLVYFVSDIHIRDEKEEKAQVFLRFLRFLEQGEEKSTLILGGDIFDLWLGGHRYFIDKFKSIVDQIHRLVEEGHTVYYFEGNHDLHLRSFWQDQMGVIVYTDPEFFLFDGVVVRFEHGDQMDPDDRGYHFLRWLLRTSVLSWLILHLPDWLVVKIGNVASGVSRSYTDSWRDEDKIRSIIRHHATRAYDKRPFDVIVHGHVHLRDEYDFERENRKILSFNLGSWDKNTRILQFSKGRWAWTEVE